MTLVTLVAELLANPAVVRALTADVVEPLAPDAARVAQALAAAFGPACVALVHYGSHAQRSNAAPESAYDFFVIVTDYEPAYEALARSHGLPRTPRTAARLNRVLPPNIIAVRARDMTPPAVAKCAVLSLADLAHAVSAGANDHFIQGRLFQHVQLAWSRDRESRAAVLDALASCRARTCEWGRPYLPDTFDAAGYLRALLTRSFAAEIRPEDEDRIETLTGAQRASLAPVYDALLHQLAARKVIVREGDVYHPASPAPAPLRRRWERYFARSKRRATLRWAKYVILYDGWVDYIAAKVERRSGVRVALTSRERRWPLLFLWPRVLRYLRARPQRRR